VVSTPITYDRVRPVLLRDLTVMLRLICASLLALKPLKSLLVKFLLAITSSCTHPGWNSGW
jgi:hypothetical protein